MRGKPMQNTYSANAGAPFAGDWNSGYSGLADVTEPADSTLSWRQAAVPSNYCITAARARTTSTSVTPFVTIITDLAFSGRRAPVIPVFAASHSITQPSRDSELTNPSNPSGMLPRLIREVS